MPYEEKEEVKNRYAKWDPVKKKWYATNPNYYFRFTRWLYGEAVAQNKVYIAVGHRNCWRCKDITKVYALAVKGEDLIDLVYGTDNFLKETGYDMAIIPINYRLPNDIRVYLESNTTCEDRYSRTVNSNYFANICEHCNSLQGNFFVYDEVDSPFKGIEKSPSQFIEFELENDICIDYEVGSSCIAPDVKLFDENKVVKSNTKISK